MMEITGISPLPRLITGLYSFDKMFEYKKQIGMPLRSTVELIGFEGVGKSTFSYFLAGKVNPAGKIHVVDLETSIEPGHFQSTLEHAGFEGTVCVVDPGTLEKPRLPSEMIDEAVDALLKEGCDVSILDSIGMLQSSAEIENQSEEANMGRRAKIMAQVSRKLLHHMKLVKDPKLFIMVNHMHPNIGFHGYSTPGGETKNFAAGQRIRITRKEQFDDGSTLVEMSTSKRRYGGLVKGNVSYAYIIPEWGISEEMTAVFDCVVLGIAQRSTVVKVMVDGEMKSAGRLSALQDKAVSEDRSDFQPFFVALKGVE